jgi:cellulose synthase/poly-beta-1,6-N-acetylglucosamine synthase-like glycosyltransferase
VVIQHTDNAAVLTNGNRGEGPTVGVLISARHEAAHVGQLLDSLDSQTYPKRSVEVILAIAETDEATRGAVADWAATRELRVRTVPNPGVVTAAGLNACLMASSSEVVIVLGAHAFVERDFVERSVGALMLSGAACAGGALRTVGRSPNGRAVAAAMTSRVGVGAAVFRTGNSVPCNVDTVAFGAYRRSTLESLGGFDVSLVGAEDDELNFRLRRSGGEIYYDPEIVATYYCRETFRGLAQQYFSYGRGKWWVVRKHKRLPSLRMLAPSALVMSLAGGLSLALVTSRRSLFVVPATTYGVAILAAGAAVGRRQRVAWWRVSSALAVLHLSYGAGVFAGMARAAPRHRQDDNGSATRLTDGAPARADRLSDR